MIVFGMILCYGCPGIMTRLYISQKRIDAWISDNRLQIDGDTMTLVELGRSFKIVPAVRILTVEVGARRPDNPEDDTVKVSDQAHAADPHDLIGKVKDEEELVKLGADHLASSLILNDTAYRVENGYVGEPLPPSA